MIEFFPHLDALALFDVLLCVLAASAIAFHHFCRLTGLCVATDTAGVKLSRMDYIWSDSMSFATLAAFMFVAGRLLSERYLLPVDASEVGVNLIVASILFAHKGDMESVFPAHSSMAIRAACMAAVLGWWLVLLSSSINVVCTGVAG